MREKYNTVPGFLDSFSKQDSMLALKAEVHKYENYYVQSRWLEEYERILRKLKFQAIYQSNINDYQNSLDSRRHKLSCLFRCEGENWRNLIFASITSRKARQLDLRTRFKILQDSIESKRKITVEECLRKINRTDEKERKLELQRRYGEDLKAQITMNETIRMQKLEEDKLLSRYTSQNEWDSKNVTSTDSKIVCPKDCPKSVFSASFDKIEGNYSDREKKLPTSEQFALEEKDKAEEKANEKLRNRIDFEYQIRLRNELKLKAKEEQQGVEKFLQDAVGDISEISDHEIKKKEERRKHQLAYMNYLKRFTEERESQERKIEIAHEEESQKSMKAELIRVENEAKARQKIMENVAVEQRKQIKEKSTMRKNQFVASRLIEKE